MSSKQMFGASKGKAKAKLPKRVQKIVADAHQDDEEEMGGQPMVVSDTQGRSGDDARFNIAMRKVLADRVLVVFPETVEPDGRYPIKCGLQGIQFRIARNVEVAVPRAVLEMLRSRQIGAIHQTLNRNRDGFDEEVSHASRFPYQVVQDPAPAAARAA